MEVLLSAFKTEYCNEIASWAVDADAARAWGGATMSFPICPSSFIDWIGDPGIHPLVAHRGGELVGYGEIWQDEVEREIELARIIVKPSQRRTGIGCALVEGLLNLSLQYGYEEAFVRVVPQNTPAIRCYRRVGFRCIPSDEQDRFNQRQPIEYLWLVYRMTI